MTVTSKLAIIFRNTHVLTHAFYHIYFEDQVWVFILLPEFVKGMRHPTGNS